MEPIFMLKIIIFFQNHPSQGMASSSVQKWSQLIGRGLQEGFVESISNDQGYIMTKNPFGPKALLKFYHKDIENKQFHDVIKNTKLHFEVSTREGNTIAINIKIIS